MDTRATSDGTSARGRRGLIVIGATAACLLVGALVVVLATRDDATSTVEASAGETSTSGWTRLPDPPLSPRVGASAAWTGEEVVVVGGWEFLCPPGADCSGPTEAPFTDGAAFDPSTQTWRPIADAPTAFEGEDPAVARGAVFFLVDCDVSFLGTGSDPAENRCPTAREPTVLLRYDPAPDTWTQVPGPTGDHPLQIEAVGGSIIAFAGTEERGEQPEWHFDIQSSVWTEIPDDPLPLLYDRSIVAADDGRTALLLGADAESGPTSEPSQEVNLAARLDLETMAWTALPPSPSRGYRAWGVDDLVVLEPHFGGSGGLFDPSSSTWSALTAEGAEAVHSDQVAGVLGATGATYADASGWVLDVERSEWHEIEPIDDRSVFPHTSVTAVGRDLFSFGGQRWTSAEGELLGDAWMWIAPKATSGSVTSTSLLTTTSAAPATVVGSFELVGSVFQ